MRLLRAFLVLSLLLLPQMANAETLMMATTTSTQDTGLLEYLQPIFKKDTGIDLKWISVGTGKALAHGKDCDVDVLLVHAPALEEKFVADGFGVDRHQVMYNDFVLIGCNRKSSTTFYDGNRFMWYASFCNSQCKWRRKTESGKFIITNIEVNEVNSKVTKWKYLPKR